MSKLPPIGAHMSVSKGYDGAVKEALSIGATAMQIFAKSPMQSKLRAITDEEAAAVAKVPNRKDLQAIVIHASYLLNFAKKMEDDSYQINSLVEDVLNAAKIGGIGAVAHMGKTLEMDKEEAEAMFIKNIGTVLEKTKHTHAKVLLENTAGQGSEMGFQIADYGRIFKKIHATSKRVGACIDTAHLFGGGYDLTNEAGVSAALAELEKYVGLENLFCIHFNDSKKPCGSHVDRHEDIGHGQIGINGLKLFAQKLIKERPDLPLILETPEGFDTYESQIKKVESWF
jgi:deoxyribonuclease-4